MASLSILHYPFILVREPLFFYLPEQKQISDSRGPFSKLPIIYKAQVSFFNLSFYWLWKLLVPPSQCISFNYKILKSAFQNLKSILILCWKYWTRKIVFGPGKVSEVSRNRPQNRRKNHDNYIFPEAHSSHKEDQVMTKCNTCGVWLKWQSHKYWHMRALVTCIHERAPWPHYSYRSF